MARAAVRYPPTQLFRRFVKVVYRAGLFERVPADADRVRWRLNAKGRQIVENAARGRTKVLIDPHSHAAG